jgi:hypothetical protein
VDRLARGALEHFSNRCSEITDLTTNTSFSHTYTIDIPAFTGGITAFVGFTGGTGALGTVQDVWGGKMVTPTPAASRSPAPSKSQMSANTAEALP